MSDDASLLPWTPQQWAALRSVVQDSARKSRVASTFLPIVGSVRREDQTVPANQLNLRRIQNKQRGESRERLEVTSGKTLHLTTISSNVYLRGSEVADPELHVAKSLVRRAAEVLARLEDAIIFNGLPKEEVSRYPVHRKDATLIVEPLIYRISGGRDHTGLLDAPDTFWDWLVKTRADRQSPGGTADLKATWATLRNHKELLERASSEATKLENKLQAEQDPAKRKELQRQLNLVKASQAELTSELDRLRKDVSTREGDDRDMMCVRVDKPTTDDPMPIVKAVIDAVQKLEQRGHFGPIAAVFGHELFREAMSPAGTASVLPTQSFLPFLNGGELYRSSTIPEENGVLIALGGAPVELVVARDMDVRFLQMTLEPRYVLRVFERFVLRIKELDAVCRITKETSCLDENFVPRKVES